MELAKAELGLGAARNSLNSAHVIEAIICTTNRLQVYVLYF